MEALKERIRREGRVLPGNIIKVDGFLNHRVDTVFMEELADEPHVDQHRVHRSDQMHQVRPLQGGLLLSGHHQVPAALSGGLRHERHRQGPVWPGGHRP